MPQTYILPMKDFGISDHISLNWIKRPMQVKLAEVIDITDLLRYSIKVRRW